MNDIRFTPLSLNTNSDQGVSGTAGLGGVNFNPNKPTDPLLKSQMSTINSVMNTATSDKWIPSFWLHKAIASDEVYYTKHKWWQFNDVQDAIWDSWTGIMTILN